MQWGLRTVIALGILTCPIALQQGADARLPDASTLEDLSAAQVSRSDLASSDLFLFRWVAAEQDIEALQHRSAFEAAVLVSLGSFGSGDPWAVPPQRPEMANRPPIEVHPKAIRPEPKVRVIELEFDRPALAPLAHSVFCVKYPADCAASQSSGGGRPIKLTEQRWSELERVNAEVNRAIIPQPNTRGLAAEKWLIAPKSGECHDYAVTKRHELMAMGWSAANLLLAEVVVPSGEHHLVLLVRTSEGDFVADNLTHEIRSWYKTPYQWLRVQSSSNPMIWSTVSGRPVWIARGGLSRHAQS